MSPRRMTRQDGGMKAQAHQTTETVFDWSEATIQLQGREVRVWYRDETKPLGESTEASGPWND